MRFFDHLNLFLIVVVLAGTSQLAAQGTEATTDALTGSWAWTHKGNSKGIECEMTLIEKDGKVNCTLRAGNKVYKSADGTFKDGTFHVTIDVKDSDKKYVFTGKPEKNQIKGIYCVPSSGDKQLDWVARKTVSLSEFVGKWKLFFETPDGDRLEPTFELKEVDGKPEVTFSTGPEIKITSTKFRRGVLIVAADVVYEGEEVEIEYELNFNKNVIGGVVFYSFKSNDNEGELEVEGERVK